ncbi:MAG TPA: DUF885 domain-containing protein [Terriglobales bacterium]|nr:DUF885 domain-containing protein [Terriglobales bacterium]
MNKIATLAAAFAFAVWSLPVSMTAQSHNTPATKHNNPEWVKRSDGNAQILLKVIAELSPEGAGQIGIDGLDDKISDFSPGANERARRALTPAVQQLEAKLDREKDPLVVQDLHILIKAGKDSIKETELSDKYDIPYSNLSRRLFFGIRALLDDQVEPSRYPAAVVRLKKYAGMEPGFKPAVDLEEATIREKLNTPGLIGPYKGEVEKDLATSSTYIDGIGKLFEKYHLQGYEEAYAKLKEQMTGYNEFVTREVLPKARADFRLPPEEYAFQLEQVGIDIPPAQLAQMAHASFDQLQKQMQELAPVVAKQHGWNLTDYRDVIRQLKKDQWTGPSILPNYEKRIAEIEDIIRKQQLVTLPDRPMRIRLASAAEAASTPAPNMHPPRLLNNHGESGEFVLPLSIPGNKAGETQKFDDFTYAAASWTLEAHEGRPGHELQFDAMIEHGISAARAVFAFNSVNVEGWGLYAEAITLPYMPPDGQLISLDFRLLRAARAFIDPELQEGKLTPDQARKILTNDVVTSTAMANSEVERYMFWAPGQATAYFYGYTRLEELRQETEKKLGTNFNQKKFHDFILAQGLLPPNLLRKAVMDDFIPQTLHPTNVAETAAKHS